MKRLFLHAARKASPLVGEVGGGRPASAGQENLLSAEQSADADRCAPPPNPPHKGEGYKLAPLIPLLALTACAATQQPDAVAAGTPGFWLGLWHGFIFPVAWVISLFTDKVAIYAVPNSGGWYDFGYFVGIVFLGVGARKTRTVYKDRVINIRARRIN